VFIKFWYVVKLVWIERMAYRVNFVLEILSGLISSLIVVLLWLAIYRSAAHEVIGGYSIQEMVTYLLGAGLINTFILNTAENPETSQSIQDGSLSALLVQPMSPYRIWLTRDLGTKAFYLFIGSAGYLVVFFLFREYLTFTMALRRVPLLIIVLLMAAVLQFLLFEALSLLAFWVENTYGIRFTMRVIMEVIGGALIPLSFFPQLLQKVFLVLPFSFLIYLPMQMYLGKISQGEIVIELLKEAGWIAGFALLNLVIWKRGIRHYVAHGD
jgi:ABC-2 type transport system permease protein